MRFLEVHSHQPSLVRRIRYRTYLITMDEVNTHTVNDLINALNLGVQEGGIYSES